MKKLIISSVFALVLSGSALAQQTDPSGKKEERKVERKEKRVERRSEVNDLSKQSFSTDFGNIQGIWLRKDNMDEVSFTKNNKNLIAYYDDNAMIIGTTENKTIKDLPMKAQDIIKAKYSDYSIANVVYYKNSDANPTNFFMYGTQIEDADNYFVDLKKGNKNIILEVPLDGQVIYFATLK